VLGIDDYRKGWALRYLREAKAELSVAQKMPPMASSKVLESLRKAQAAIYYSLGEPLSVELIVQQTLGDQLINDPILRCLVEIERTVQRIAQTTKPASEKAIQEAGEIIQIASDIVELFTGEKVN
jgi:hypothetical protein